jgi:hypothetical protein
MGELSLNLFRINRDTNLMMSRQKSTNDYTLIITEDVHTRTV